MAPRRRPTGLWRSGKVHPGEHSRARLAGAVAELSLERPAETGSVCETEVLGNRRDRPGRHGVGQDDVCFEQALALNVSGDAACVLEQPIKIGAGHPREPASRSSVPGWAFAGACARPAAPAPCGRSRPSSRDGSRRGIRRCLVALARSRAPGSTTRARLRIDPSGGEIASQNYPGLPRFCAALRAALTIAARWKVSN
jgi:hypothetical protein